MSVADEIKKNASETFRTRWTVRDGQVVPDASDLKLANDAVRFEKAFTRISISPRISSRRRNGSSRARFTKRSSTQPPD
jgi:hypothetical protein